MITDYAVWLVLQWKRRNSFFGSFPKQRAAALATAYKQQSLAPDSFGILTVLDLAKDPKRLVMITVVYTIKN